MNETQKSVFLALVAKIAHGTSTNQRENQQINNSLTNFTYLYDLKQQAKQFTVRRDDTCFRDLDAIDTDSMWFPLKAELRTKLLNGRAYFF